ncbi:M17 family peptidase N-terminal domain-containing protein, partial [Pseudomonas aeruginosa]
IQAVLKILKETNTREVVSYLTEIELKDRDLYWNIRFAIETIEHTNYQFDHFKSQKTEASVLESFIFNADCEQAQQAIAHANAISSG